MSRSGTRIVATIEARMSSSRLPGKVLMRALGKPMLHHLVMRLRAVPSLDAIVLATTVSAEDDVLEAFASNEEIACFRGSEQDVMGRVIDAARFSGADVIVEITGDCPIIDPQIIEQLIRMFMANGADYVSNVQVRSYPDGMDAQVFRLATLEHSASMTTDPLDHEHVTLHIRRHPEIFRPVHLVAPPEMHWPELGLTLDELADFTMIRRILEILGAENPLFSCLDVVRLLRANPNLLAINRSVGRKGDS